MFLDWTAAPVVYLVFFSFEKFPGLVDKQYYNYLRQTFIFHTHPLNKDVLE